MRLTPMRYSELAGKGSGPPAMGASYAQGSSWFQRGLSLRWRGPDNGGSRYERTRRYLVDPKLSLLDKTRIQAQVLVPVLRALRLELGKEKADAIVKQALRGWSKQLFTAIGDGYRGQAAPQMGCVAGRLGPNQ